MVEDITLHEHGLVERGSRCRNLEKVGLSVSDWDWLYDFSVNLSQSGPAFARPAWSSGVRALRVGSYVGLVQLPSGASLEIVPKTSAACTVEQGRASVLRMLQALEFAGVEAPDASLASIRGPLREALIGRFLRDAEHLIASGLRSQYCLLQADEPFLKGRLRVSELVRRPPQLRAKLPLEFDHFLFDRPENRLLHWAIRRVYDWSRNDGNRRLARNLLSHISCVPVSADPRLDWKRWESHRLMRGYASVRWWIALLLANEQPVAQRGLRQGVSLLFPAEVLFERYVARWLRRRVAHGFTAVSQSRAGWLARHGNEDWFCLKPDVAIRRGGQNVSVLDTKWKVLDSSEDSRSQKYGLGQGDMYQLFAYGHKVLTGIGDLFLVYPKTEKLSAPLPPFAYSTGLRLWVVPFDLECECLVHGEWSSAAPWLAAA